jgi:hypothetical protein
MANTILSISHSSPFNLSEDGASRRGNEAMQDIVTFLRALSSGVKKGTALVVNAGTATDALATAAGTVTLSTASGGTTVTINGVVFTIAAGTDTVRAAGLALLINASTNALVQYLVAATSVAGVLTITALQPGITGNCITIAASGTGATASGARLTGGVGGSNLPVTLVL